MDSPLWSYYKIFVTIIDKKEEVCMGWGTRVDYGWIKDGFEITTNVKISRL